MDTVKSYEYEVDYFDLVEDFLPEGIEILHEKKIYSHGYVCALSYTAAMEKLAKKYLNIASVSIREMGASVTEEPIEVQTDELPF